MGTLVGINISPKKGTVKTSIEEGILIEDFGLKDDAHAGKWHRQVSLLAYESFSKFSDEIKIELKYGVFGENLLIGGIENLSKIKIGTIIQINESILEVTQIGKKCHHGCEIRDIVGRCIMPVEGIFTKVIKGGIIKVGDKVCIR